jgi:hypothetical protein
MTNEASLCALHNTMYCLAFVIQALVTGLHNSHCASVQSVGSHAGFIIWRQQAPSNQSLSASGAPVLPGE